MRTVETLKFRIGIDTILPLDWIENIQEANTEGDVTRPNEKL